METTLEKEEARIRDLETRIPLLQEAITKVINNEGLADSDEELAALELENVKLKHRLAIINRAIEAEKALCASNTTLGVVSITDHLSNLFGAAILFAYPDIDNAPVVIAPSGSNPKFGDYQCNSAMPLAKILREKGQPKPPRDIAAHILTFLVVSPLVERTEVAGAGFINIFLNKTYGISAIRSLLTEGVKPPKAKKQRVVVDFSSPNIAKEMHVGHLRSTIIGESICRLLEYLGHDVLRLNHIGDWGTQFGMLISHLRDRFPKFLTETPPIGDLQVFYKESKARFDEDAEFKKRAYASVVQLQSGDPESTKAWNLICDVSRKEFQKVYERLDVTLIERGESFYQQRMEAIVKELKEKNLLEEDEGRYIMWGEKHGEGIPLTVIKSDGGFTYDTSDMATIRQRIEEEKGTWLVYVTDLGQGTHFKSIFSCARRAGIWDESKVRIDHVGFGVVLGEDGKKFKSRSGDSVKLVDLLDEGVRRAAEKLREKGRDQVLSKEELEAVQKSVAYGCIKYSDLCHNRNNEYVFSFDKMLEDKGNTAVYMLYMYTRIKSIARNCGAEFAQQLQEMFANTDASLDHEKEWKLVKVLLKYPDVFAGIAQDLCLHHLCEYVYDISTAFSEFYDTCYCIEKDKQGKIVKINKGRVLLCEATTRVLEQCFHILGLNPLDKI